MGPATGLVLMRHLPNWVAKLVGLAVTKRMPRGVMVGVLAGAMVWGSATVAMATPNGKQLIQRKGCLTCHSLNGKGGHLGPPLQTTPSWSGPERMARYLHNPRDVNPKAIMPNLHLKDAEIQAIVKFLQSFKDTATAPKGWKAK